MHFLSPLYPGSAGTTYRWNHELSDSQKSWNSLYWSGADYLKVGVFRVTVGGLGFKTANTAVMATIGSDGGTGWSSIGEAMRTETLQLSMKTKCPHWLWMSMRSAK